MLIRELLQPAIFLVLWSFVMWLWLYITRIPAILKNRIVLDPNRPPDEYLEKIPRRVQWKAENYNHLMEQPTIFYATVLVFVAAIGFTQTDKPIQASMTDVYLAWGYVITRVIHSLVQALFNHISTRFAIFMISSVLLLVLAIRVALHLFT